MGHLQPNRWRADKEGLGAQRVTIEAVIGQAHRLHGNAGPNHNHIGVDMRRLLQDGFAGFLQAEVQCKGAAVGEVMHGYNRVADMAIEC